MYRKMLIIGAVMLTLSSGFAWADSAGFADVKPDHWAATAINQLQKLGVISGYADQTFKPDAQVTRAEVAQMIYNEHQSVEKELDSLKTASNQNLENITTTAIANALPGVVVVDGGNKLGAGYFVDKTHILTAQHVIDGVADIKIKTLSENSYSAKLVNQDEDRDLALLEVNVDKDQVKPLSFADSYKLGETAIAIGHPGGLTYSVSKGIISNTKRQLKSTASRLIQVDTAISPGNSGGPLIDLNGNVIGLVDQKISAVSAEGLAFATSLEDMKYFLHQSGL